MFGTGSLYLRVKRMYGCIDFFWKCFLPPVMHPEIVSGIGIATKYLFGTESFLSSNDVTQILLEQVIE